MEKENHKKLPNFEKLFHEEISLNAVHLDRKILLKC